jgi:hypothetical protein
MEAHQSAKWCNALRLLHYTLLVTAVVIMAALAVISNGLPDNNETISI